MVCNSECGRLAALVILISVPTPLQCSLNMMLRYDVDRTRILLASLITRDPVLYLQPVVMVYQLHLTLSKVALHKLQCS